LIQDSTPKTKFCQNCGKKIDINAEICPHCGVRVGGIVRSGNKSVVLAAILSFLFPGLGHIYNGLTKKGVSFVIAYIVSAILMLILIGWILVLIVWIWALIDAIRTTESINRGEFVDDKLF
jgi:TM2 domain-containing membrane protein YozV